MHGNRLDNRLHIILVDSNDNLAKTLPSAFDKTTPPPDMMHFTHAEDVIKYLNASTTQFDVIISSYSLPGMSGHELFHKLYDRYQKPTFIMLVDSGSESAVDQILKSGVDHFAIRDSNGYYISLLPTIISLAIERHKNHQEQKKAEQALRESESRYRNLAENALDLITEIDANSVFLYLSPNHHELLGYPLADLRGKSFLGFVHHEDLPLIWKSFKDCVENIRSHQTEYRFQTQDGQWKWLQSSIKPFRTVEGEVHAVVVSRDVTEYKKLVANISTAKMEWEKTVDAVPELIAVLDNLYNIVRVNWPLAYKLGITPQKAVGLPCDPDKIPASHPNRNLRIPIFNHISKFPEHSQDTIGIYDDTWKGHFLVTLVPVRDSNQNRTGYVYVARDITELKEAEQALREMEEKFETIFRSSLDMLVIIDGDTGEIIEVSPSTTRITGYTANDLIGQHFGVLLPPDTSIPRDQFLHELIVHGEVFQNQKVIHLDGKPLFMDITATVIPWRDCRALLATFRDISERKLITDAISNAKKEWELTVDSVPELIAMFDNADRIVRVNWPMAKKLRTTPHNLVGKAINPALRNVDADNFLDVPIFRHKEALISSKSGVYETFEDVWQGHFLVSIVPIQDSSQSQTGWVYIARDITERKQAEEALQELEEKFETLFRSSLDVLLVLDGVRGKIINVNPSTTRLLHYLPEDLIGNPYTLLFPPDIDMPRETLLEELSVRDEVFQSMHVIRKDGVQVHMDMTASVISWGSERAILLVLRDVSERTQVEEELIIYRTRLEELVEERTSELTSVNKLLTQENMDRKHAEEEREKLITELQIALTKIKTLKGLIPICSSCKKIRDDKGFWNQVEVYISQHSDAEFSHGLCPDCIKKLYPGVKQGKDQPL